MRLTELLDLSDTEDQRLPGFDNHRGNSGFPAGQDSVRTDHRNIEPEILLWFGNLNQLHVLTPAEVPSPPDTFVGSFERLY